MEILLCVIINIFNHIYNRSVYQYSEGTNEIEFNYINFKLNALCISAHGYRRVISKRLDQS